MTKSTITIDIALGEDKIPEDISWKASGSTADEFQRAKAMMLAFWDSADKSALRIDLWTKEMMVDEMADFYYQLMITMADTYKRATGQDELVKDLNKKDKLAFTPTRETQTTTSARFSVSLGIMPDYTYSGTGVRVDGVSEGRAAQKAGIQTGDVVVLLGEYAVNSLETYMQALSKFKSGDSTTVHVKRGNEELTFDITFVK